MSHSTIASRSGDPFETFHGLSSAFHEAYFRWHSSGQYESAEEFDSVDDATRRPPARERDDYYAEELRIIDTHYRQLATSRVLEIGCGDGNLTWKLARRCASVVSRDLDPAAIELTQRRLDNLGLTNVTLESRGGDDTAPDDAGRYDIVFFVQVLEHVPGWDQPALFDSVWRCVAPGGCMFISTPNRWAIRDTHDTQRLFIHWLPRWLRIPLARRFGWGIPGHDPAWPYPPVLHDYVSFRWIGRRARQLVPGATLSQMTFYPTAEEWFRARADGPSAGIKRLVRALGRVLPLNYYFGEKVIVARPPAVPR